MSVDSFQCKPSEKVLRRREVVKVGGRAIEDEESTWLLETHRTTITACSATPITKNSSSKSGFFSYSDSLQRFVTFPVTDQIRFVEYYEKGFQIFSHQKKSSQDDHKYKK